MTLKRDQIDFHEVRPEHLAIHQRLLNWAKWCSSGIRNVSVHPMFKHYRHGYEEASAGSSIDTIDGHRMEKIVTALPEKHRTVLQWAYVRPYIPPLAVRKALGLSHNDLYAMLTDARTQVKNRVIREGLALDVAKV